MVTVVEKSKCCGCGACEQICPVNAIEMREDSEGFLYPDVINEICVGCNKCDTVCPVQKNNTLTNEVRKAFAVRTKDIAVLNKSTSGGISYELAKSVIEKGGVVVGACFGINNVVEHRIITSLDELRKLQGSKYVQSRISDAFKETEKHLNQGKTVLFTGTSCQVEGLLAFLGKEYDNLITHDMICHGVPSPGLWSRYLKENHWETAESIVFRDKKRGWETKSEFVVSANKKVKRMSTYNNPYVFFFGQNYSLRPICFCCPFKNDNRKSDYTVADLWGISELLPAEMNDDRGWSLLLVHTAKGLEMLDAMAERINIKEIDYDSAVAQNMMMLRSVAPMEGRKQFFIDIKSNTINRLYKKYRPKDPPVLAIKKALYPIKAKLLGK